MTPLPARNHTAPPTVSVLVTCYDLGQYLDEAIDSVFAQTFQDFEIVIVDDGSTEPETVRLLAEYQRPRTKVVRIQNRGLPGARNEAARHSSGRYLCSLDADDKLEPTWFAKAVQFLEVNPHVTFVSHWLRAFGDESWEWTPDRCDLEALLTRNTVNGAALVRREPFLEVGGFDESMTLGCEDWDLWLTMVERGFEGAIIPEVLFFYRRRHDSMSQEMLRGDTHLQLVEGLMRKHESSYRRHLDVLLAEKETAIARMLRDTHDRDLEDETWLVAEAAQRRQQLVRLRAKVDRVRSDLGLATETAQVPVSPERVSDLDSGVAGLSHERAGMGEERARSLEEKARLIEEKARLAEEAARLHRDITALHHSASWRLTQPFRTVAGWLRGTRGE